MSETPVGRAVLVFAREPIAGRVKTRLAARLGAGRAAVVYGRLLECALRAAAGVEADARELWLDQSPSGDAPVALAARHGLRLRVQAPGDLGVRMADAFDHALRTSAAVVLIGSDCPEFDAAYLEAAFAALKGHDAVIGPAADGGYVLLGLRRQHIDLFRGIDWGGPHVLDATRQRLHAVGWTWHELPVRHDVDDADDLRRFPWLESPPAVI